MVLGKPNVISDKKEKIDVEKLPTGCQISAFVCVNTKGSCFWTEGWRTGLCTCEECKSVRC